MRTSLWSKVTSSDLVRTNGLRLRYTTSHKGFAPRVPSVTFLVIEPVIC